MLLTDEEVVQCWSKNSRADDYEKYSLKEHVLRAACAIESAVLEKLKAQEPVAWQIRNGLCHAGIRGNQLDAELTAANMQKCHDLGGSLAAFNVRPLYAHPLPPADVVRDAERYKWLRDKHDGGDEMWFVYGAKTDNLTLDIDAAMKGDAA